MAEEKPALEKTISNEMKKLISNEEKDYIPPRDSTPVIDDDSQDKDDDLTTNINNNNEKSISLENIDEIPYYKRSRPIMIMSDKYAKILDKLKIDDNKYSYFWELLKAYKIHENKQSKLKIIKSIPCSTKVIYIHK